MLTVTVTTNSSAFDPFPHKYSFNNLCSFKNFVDMQILRFEHCELCKYSIASSICFLFHFYVFFMAFYTWL